MTQTASKLSSIVPVLLKLHTVWLNEVFWYVFQDEEGWQGMGIMTCNNAARIDHIMMTTTKFPTVPAYLTGPALNESPKISKTFIGYLRYLLALSPNNLPGLPAQMAVPVQTWRRVWMS